MTQTGMSLTTLLPSATAGGRVLLGPVVLQRDRAVEVQLAWFAELGIEREVAEALELKAVLKTGHRERGFESRGHNLQRIGIHDREEVIRGRGLGHAEQAIIQVHLALDALGSADPVD